MNLITYNVEVIALVVSLFSLAIAFSSAVISSKRLKAANDQLMVAKSHWEESRKLDRKNERLKFMKNFADGITEHSWKFIEYWDFPGVYPNLKELKSVIPDKSEDNQEAFGQRVVTLAHLYILLGVFSYRDVLLTRDIVGISNWANNWFEESEEAIKTILSNGDVFPLDFIDWLKNTIFPGRGLERLIGPDLITRLREYQAT